MQDQIPYVPAAHTMVDFVCNHPESFDELPFTPVDSLVLSALSYLNFDMYRYANTCGFESVPLIDILRFSDVPAMLSGGWIRSSKEAPRLLDAVARSRRYADLSVSFFVNENADVIEKQFCACTFTVTAGLERPLVYLAFRGTDGTLAGWKEDFNLSYRPVIPSQRTATAYVSGVLSALSADARIILGGHSKGGNLAEYAAATIDEAGFERVEAIFNHDGPSFLHAPSPRFSEAQFKKKLHKTVPESSVFGLILEHRDDYQVVKADGISLQQHNPFTWLVDGEDFAYQESLNASALFIDQTLDGWLQSCTTEQRERFIDTIYGLIVSNNISSWKDFQEGLIGNVSSVLRDGRNLDQETKDILAHTLRNLRDATSETVRGRVRNVVNRMRESAQAPMTK